MTLQQIKDRRRVRWVIVGLPVKMRRGDYIVDPKKYETVFFDSLGATYTPIVKQLCAYYRKKLSGVGRIRITANDGTDLSFSIRGRPILVDDGVLDEEDLARGDVGLNIPDGEVFVAPLEHSANGRIRFDFVFPSGFGLIKNLWITFEGGKVTSFSADGDGAKRFQKFLDSNTGEKDRIAELGIGTNPAAQFIGAILIDEKIYGSIHIAIGSNTGAYHGKNKASSHLDMIKIMRGQGGRVYADERLVMDNGLPVGLK